MCVYFVCDLLWLHDYVKILDARDRMTEKNWASLLIYMLIFVLLELLMFVIYCNDMILR